MLFFSAPSALDFILRSRAEQCMAYVCRSVVQQKLTRMKCNFQWMTEPPDEFHTELINTVHKEAIHHRAAIEQDGYSESTL